jgi:4'-phosphopantetheinyl transferase
MVALWRIEESKDNLFSMLPQPWKDQLNYNQLSPHNIAARILAHKLCPDFDCFEKDSFGKPYFESKNLKISITHSGNFAGFMYTSDDSCGIDIELISDRINRIKHKFLGEKENQFESLGLKGLYLVWCAKEALYKYYGLKGLDFKKNLKVDYTSIQTSGEITGRISKEDFQITLNLHYQFFDEYLLIHTL